MIDHLKDFFNPPVSTYSYSKSIELITNELQEVFSNKVTLFSQHDLNGKFISDDKFILEIISFAYTKGAKYGAKLEGEIVEVEKDLTIIKTIARPSPVWYTLFFLSIIFSFILLYRFMSSASIKFLFASTGMFIGGPFLSVFASNIGISSIRERYYLYVHKRLSAK